MAWGAFHFGAGEPELDWRERSGPEVPDGEDGDLLPPLEQSAAGADLEGIVLTMSGRPVAGAEVHVHRFGRRSWLDALDGSPHRSVRADRDGRFGVPGVRSGAYVFVAKHEGLAQGFTHCFFVTFKDEAARAAYLPHPEHKAFVDLMKPHMEKVLVIDYWAEK